MTDLVLRLRGRDGPLQIAEGAYHVPAAISNLECLDRIMLDFCAAPRSIPDTACVAEMRAPAFEVAGKE